MITICTERGFFSDTFRYFDEEQVKVTTIQNGVYASTSCNSCCFGDAIEVRLNTGEIVRGTKIEGGCM